jgi:hypothetical protein
LARRPDRKREKGGDPQKDHQEDGECLDSAAGSEMHSRDSSFTQSIRPDGKPVIEAGECGELCDGI